MNTAQLMTDLRGSITFARRFDLLAGKLAGSPSTGRDFNPVLYALEMGSKTVLCGALFVAIFLLWGLARSIGDPLFSFMADVTCGFLTFGVAISVYGFRFSLAVPLVMQVWFIMPLTLFVLGSGLHPNWIWIGYIKSNMFGIVGGMLMASVILERLGELILNAFTDENLGENRFENEMEHLAGQAAIRLPNVRPLIKEALIIRGMLWRGLGIRCRILLIDEHETITLLVMNKPPIDPQLEQEIMLLLRRRVLIGKDYRQRTVLMVKSPYEIF